MKLKLTIEGKVYEVEVDAAEPEQPRPGYVPPVGQTRVSAAAPPAAPPPRVRKRPQMRAKCAAARSPAWWFESRRRSANRFKPTMS